MEEISAVVLAVGYARQPQRLAARRTEAVAFLAEHYETDSRYFKRRRLTRLGLPGSLPAPAPLPQPTIGRRLRRRLRRARSSVGQWLVGLPDLSPAPIGQPRDALSRRQFAYKSRVAKVSRRQTEDLRGQHTERTQGQSIVH